MAVRKIRPRFDLSVPLSAAEVVSRLEARMNQPDSPCGGMVADEHQTVDVHVCERHQHYWSPALSITVTDDEDGEGSRIHGIVGPNPGVWTLFAMLYMGVLTFLMGLTIFGLIQWWLDLTPWGLYLMPVLILALVAMYVVSRIGQKMAAPQTVLLREFLEETLGIPVAEREEVRRDPYHG